MEIGDVVKAEIVNIKDYGAFAEFDGGSGLIYFTQIVPRVEYGAIEDVLNLGDTVNCAISDIKPSGKISLTMKIKRKEARKAKITEVKQDIQNLSEEDTNIRSIWMVLTDIQHFMLKYMQMPIPIKNGSTKIDTKGEKLTAEIDQEIHFDAFQNEVRRVFSADVFKHETLSGFWYFETDAELYDPETRQLFADECSNMYVRMQANPVLEYDKISQKIEDLTSKILERFDTVGNLVTWEQRMGDDTMDRNLTMRMGLPMYLLLMDRFNIKSIHVCGTGLWYGIYLQHLFNVAD